MSHHHPTREEELHIHEELASDEFGHEHHVHVTPFIPMAIVFAVLVLFTVITVLTAKFVDLPGTGNLMLAMALASTKGTLVFAYFMHLRYDKLINTVVVLASLFAVALFIGFSMLDLGSRDVINRQYEGQEIVKGGTMPDPDNPNVLGVVNSANVKAMKKYADGHHGHDDEHHDDKHHDDHGDDHGDDH